VIAAGGKSDEADIPEVGRVLTGQKLTVKARATDQAELTGHFIHSAMIFNV
jgi:hypothetical protein